MYHGKIRVAVCQIECHPALKVGDIDYICEPFVPSVDTNLFLASIARDNLQIIDLQEQFKEEYLKWHAYRLKSILDFLKSIEEIPDIIVFPEGSIPFEILPGLEISLR